MSQIAYTGEETVYIKGIGYASLVRASCSKIGQQVQTAAKKQTIHFDPELFNPDANSEDKKHGKEAEVVAERRRQSQAADLPLPKPLSLTPNIMQARMDGGALVYTPQGNLTKSIVLVVSCLLAARKKQVTVGIEIANTVDALKKAIFAQLDEQIGQFYDIRLFTLNPCLCELNVGSKTVSQLLIKDHSKLILTASHAFSFRPIAQPKSSKYKVTLCNNTIVSSKIVEEQKKVQPEGKSQDKVELKEEGKLENQANSQRREQQAPRQANAQPLQQEKTNRIHAKCTTSFTSGKRYWQIKLQKLPAEEQDLVIGVCIQPQTKPTPGFWDCECGWGYLPLTGKKLLVEKDEVTNLCEEEIESYGFAAKQNDVIGVLLRFMSNKVKLTFYKNSVSCGLAYCIDTFSPKGDRRQFVPFVNVGGECQVTLDPKAMLPLDSYRLN